MFVKEYLHSYVCILRMKNVMAKKLQDPEYKCQRELGAYAGKKNCKWMVEGKIFLA